MNYKNLEKGKLVVRYSSGKRVDLEVICEIGNYGYIVSRNVIINTINEKGNLEKEEKTEYNILLKDGRYATEYWFDTYEFDDFGLCIFGVERGMCECQKLMNINEYVTSNGKNLLPEYYYKYGVINTLGINTIKPLYDRIDFGEENTVVAYHNGLLGFVDTTTGKHITSIAFPHLSHFSEGLAEVEWNGLSGYVDRKRILTNPINLWEYAIAPKFTQAGNFKNGVAEVEYNGENRYINKDGVFITKETARLLKKNN